MAQESSSLGNAVKVGSVLGAGAAGFMYRRQIGTGLRNLTEMTGTMTAGGIERITRSTRFKETMDDIGTFTSAVNFATDGRGVMSHMRNPERFNR